MRAAKNLNNKGDRGMASHDESAVITKGEGKKSDHQHDGPRHHHDRHHHHRSMEENKKRKQEREEERRIFNTIGGNHSEHRLYTKIEIENQLRDIDEAMILYNSAEKAAKKIQQTFREKRLQEGDKNSSESATDIESADNEKEIDKNQIEENEEDSSRWFTLIFLALTTAILVLPKMLMSCYSLVQKLFGGDDTGGADAIANTTMPQSGGGGGGGGAAPTGGEAAGAQGAMAAQAAGSAASGAASGVAAGAAAGAVASASAAAATAGATAAAAGAAQVATVVAVSAAAVAATAAGVSVAVSTLNPTNMTLLSKCGLVNPDYREGRFSLVFEGFPRVFEEHNGESWKMESLVMDAYNNITVGDDSGVTGCQDPFSREMQNATMVNQTFTPAAAENDKSILEVLFQATVTCDKCSSTRPLFGSESEDTHERKLQSMSGGFIQKLIWFDIPSLFRDDTEELSRRRALQAVSSNKFFQLLIQLVLLETDRLSEIGELPTGFVQISKAFVVTNDNEEVLVTEVRYEKTGEAEILQFRYSGENGEQKKEVVKITSNGDVVPTTPFPTFQPTPQESVAPSVQPSMQPSRSPSESPSAHPTQLPSKVPSSSPSEAPSERPSTSPSALPSESPSYQPSTVPSSSPSSVPSSQPSMIPSMVPSSEPSMVPSTVPSFDPSMVPSSQPSMVPSMVPSFVPSMVPSMVPSFVPSMVPSMVPSFVPSMVPSMVPSSVPSVVPSSAPSMAPSKIPTDSPSSSPTAFYLGCWTDNASRELTILLRANFNLVDCVDRCGAIGYAYAGMQVGHECYCGNSYGSLGPSTACTQTCADGSQCGGPWANSIYRTNTPNPIEPSLISSQYLGCWTDAETRDVEFYLADNYGPNGCILDCKARGYPYASLQVGNACFCGVDYGMYGTASNCDMACTYQENMVGSGSTFYCGGGWANSIYSTT